MKVLVLSILLLLSLGAKAQNPIVVESSSTTTAPGIGGSAQLGYAFAKGDVVNIEAKASKQLQLMLVYRFPEEVLGRVKYTKQPKLTFTMEEAGIVVFRFVSDRDGTNNVTYTVTRTPASSELENYNTKVTWQLPSDHAGRPIPKRVSED